MAVEGVVEPVRQRHAAGAEIEFARHRLLGQHRVIDPGTDFRPHDLRHIGRGHWVDVGIGEALVPQAEITLVPHPLEMRVPLGFRHLLEAQRRPAAMDEAAARRVHLLAQVIELLAHPGEVILEDGVVADGDAVLRCPLNQQQAARSNAASRPSGIVGAKLLRD